MEKLRKQVSIRGNPFFCEKSLWKAVKLGNKAGKTTEEATGEGAPMGENAVSPLPDAEAPLAMMEIEKTPISTPLHDMPPPPDEKWVW